MDWEYYHIPVDEDEGSCPRGRVNRLDARSKHMRRVGKIERSAEAFQVRHHLNSFPPIYKPQASCSRDL